MKGYIVYASHTMINNKTVIQLFGKLENGQSFAALNTLEPYFFLETKDIKKVKRLLGKFKTKKTDLTTFQGEKVTKISAENQTDLNKLNRAIAKEILTYEADIKPHIRFKMDNNLLGTINIEGDYEPSERVDRVYEEPKITSAEYKPELKVISLDIESGKSNGDELFCIGLTSNGYKKNFMVTDKKLQHTISCKNEQECLIKFKTELLKQDPDIITGWNVIDFDLFYLKEKFRKYRIPFDLGRNNEPSKVRLESGFFRSSSATISGRQVLDALSLIRDPFIKEAPSIKQAEFKSFQLEHVAQTILGKTKLIKGKHRHHMIESHYKTNQQALVDYNIQDCELVYDILKETKIIELALERTQLTGLTMDRLTASIAAFDSLYIREARSRGLVSPTTRFGLKEERITGGYVYSSNPGIYHNVLVLDFKSLYPSIIRTFNIDPASFLEKKEKGAIESPNKAHFKNTEGVLPDIIEKLHKAREKAKKEKRELSNYAIKIIQNSFFGVLASPNCRYFNLDIGNAITHFGQFIIKTTIKKIEKKGYKIIYGDTDSIFVETNLEKEKANSLGREIESEITKFYDGYVKKKYKRKSYLELEFEKQYLSLAIPKVRGAEGAVAAKKRYAGLRYRNGKEELEIVGLEAIRGDWTEAARDFQKQLLLKVFRKQPVEKFIKDYIEKVMSGDLDKKLIYKKSIRKALDKYTKTTPPHVKAARKLESLDSNVIEYYVTTDGPEPIQKHKHKIDYDHYIKKQIHPIAKQILDLLGKDFDDILEGSKQAKLF